MLNFRENCTCQALRKPLNSSWETCGEIGGSCVHIQRFCPVKDIVRNVTKMGLKGPFWRHFLQCCYLDDFEVWSLIFHHLLLKGLQNHIKALKVNITCMNFQYSWKAVSVLFVCQSVPFKYFEAHWDRFSYNISLWCRDIISSFHLYVVDL